ncbi:hypothetical protein LEP1GSC125_1236 [Leptospira mayottensis 200901122]|uniref:Uncharacterized protein n=1 Tax=Leptospira mayottensis 200901122 TaxID=1193010 RepID=A0AA87MP78_9LEPT|nr:hypothetical protein LEP1GSC125_1236 [Leptospira mayottensis 200901122]
MGFSFAGFSSEVLILSFYFFKRNSGFPDPAFYRWCGSHCMCSFVSFLYF